jgi:hypothetical protein
MLVLSNLSPHDPISRSTSLPERQITGGKGRSVGRKDTGWCESTSGQPQMGASTREVPGAVGSGGRVMADGTDEDGAYAARMDEWVAWEAVEGAAPRGEG